MKWISFFVVLTTFYSQAQNTPSQLELVDFKTARVHLELNETSTEIKGEVTYKVDILKGVSSIFVDAKNLVDYKVTVDQQEAKTFYDGEKLTVSHPFEAGSASQIKISYTSYPSKALYHIDADKDEKWEQVWTQGQGKYTSNWLPSLDDMNDKVIWNLSITAPVSKTVIANGKLINSNKQEQYITWDFEMDQPISSYLVALAAGNYEVKKDSSSTGIPLEYYYYSGEEDQIASTYQYSKRIFDFLEGEIGVAYPWQNYKQVPVKDFLYSGMENTGMTIFSDAFFTDELGANDRSYVNVNAHELAHQWFGDLVTETEATHHWLHEGFASYYALLAEKEIYGNTYFQTQLYEYAEALNEQSAQGKSTPLLDPKANSLTFYQHGAWALHALKDLIGEFSFRESVTRYLIHHKYKNVTTKDFLDVVAEVSNQDLSEFETTWLQDTTFPTAESLRILRKQPVMEQYFQLAARRISTFDESYNSYRETLEAPVEIELVKEMVAQLSIHEDVRKYDLLQKAADLNNLEVNQLIVLSTPEINDRNRSLISSMINDPSYVTRESVLFLLWNDTIDKRKLLDDTRAGWEKINPTLDMAWIVLALNSSGYKNNELLPYLTRLQSYTSSQYATELRTAALDYLINLDAMSQQNYIDLMEASLHHVWRFYENSRDALKALYKRDSGKYFINQSMDNFNPSEIEKLKKILNIE